MIKKFLSKIGLYYSTNPTNKAPTEKKPPNITSPYRVNRIIRSEWKAGKCVKIDFMPHYYVYIDGEARRMSIVEIDGAITALEEFERKQMEKHVET